MTVTIDGRTSQVENGTAILDAALDVRTDTPAVRDARRTVVELLLAQAPDSKDLAKFAADLGVAQTPFEKTKDGKCVLCGLCVRTCNEVMGRGAISMFGACGWLPA